MSPSPHNINLFSFFRSSLRLLQKTHELLRNRRANPKYRWVIFGQQMNSAFRNGAKHFYISVSGMTNETHDYIWRNKSTAPFHNLVNMGFHSYALHSA